MPLFNASLFNAGLFGGPVVAGAPVRQVGNGLLYPALRKAGITLGPGRTPSTAQFQDAIDELNRLAASLNCDRFFIYSIARAEYPLDPVQPSYTIGESPDPLQPADLAGPRPQLIESANVIWGGGVFRYQLGLATDLEWSKIRWQGLANSIPSILYNDRAFPLSTLYFYGQPASGQTLELFTWTHVPQFLTITDEVLLPGQYEDALVLNLAVRLAPHFQRDVRPDVMQQARESLMRLESINAPQPIAEIGSVGSCGCGGGYNVYSDEFK